jgi:hypothetical protein
VQSVLPCIESRAVKGRAGHRAEFVEIDVGGRIGDNVAHRDACLFDRRDLVADYGIALHDLSAAAMASQDNLPYIRK